MVNNAYERSLKRLWDGFCDVIVLQSRTDETTGRTVQEEVKILQDEPCRVSYSNLSTTASKSEAAEVSQVIKLFVSKEVEIPEGAKIIVRQEGKTETYRCAGKPAVYSIHQEIMLKTFKEWA